MHQWLHPSIHHLQVNHLFLIRVSGGTQVCPSSVCVTGRNTPWTSHKSITPFPHTHIDWVSSQPDVNVFALWDEAQEEPADKD